MITMRTRAAFAAALLLVAALPAQAQRNYSTKPMNFDLWCQETADLPVERCQKRLPEDVATFEAFRTKFEQYEIPYLQQKAKDDRLDVDILHNDPIDRSQARQAPNDTQSTAPTPQLQQ